MAHFMCSELLATGLDSRDQFRKDTKMEPDGTKDEIMEDAAEDDDEGRPADEIESDTENDGGDVLPEFQHKFEQSLRQPSRNLVVRDLVLCFQPESVYGRRSAFLKALMVTVPQHTLEIENTIRTICIHLTLTYFEAKGPLGSNIFWKSPAWKRGLVTDVRMCARSEMWRPSTRLSMDAALTDVQEQKQVPYIQLAPYHQINITNSI